MTLEEAHAAFATAVATLKAAQDAQAALVARTLSRCEELAADPPERVVEALAGEAEAFAQNRGVVALLWAVHDHAAELVQRARPITAENIIEAAKRAVPARREP